MRASQRGMTYLELVATASILLVLASAILPLGRTATVSAPRKSVFHTPRSPTSAGRLRASGAERKCSSIA